MQVGGNGATTFSGTHSNAGANNPLTSHTHPSIVDCGADWNSHRYWACVTPWIGSGWPAADRYEDPMVFYSDDLATWTPINRGDTFANLFDAYTTLGATYLSSDARLVFDPSTSIMHCFWRITNGVSAEWLVHLQSADGATWAPASGVGNYDTLTLHGASTGTAFRHADCVDAYTSALSPSILVVNGMWHMWTMVRTGSNTYNKMRYYQSGDGLNWQGGDIVPVWFTDDYCGAWHSHVDYDSDTGKYVMAHMLGRKAGEYGVIQDNTLSTFLSVSDDGIHWIMDDCPIMVSGPENPSAAVKITYKPACVRVGVNSWLFANSYTTTAGSAIEIYGPVTISFDKPIQTKPINGVFNFPQGRWYGNKYNVPQNALIQEQPGWRNAANNAVNITSGTLNLRKRAASAAKIVAGNKANHTYLAEIWLKPTTANAKIRIIAENIGENIGINYDFFGGLNNEFKISESGAKQAHVLTTAWQFWRLEVSEASNGNRTINLFVDDALVLTDTRTLAQVTTGQGILQIECSGDTNDTDGIDVRYAIVAPLDMQRAVI